MIRTILFSLSGQIQTITPDQIAADLKKEDKFLWLDMGADSEEIGKPLLQEVFGFHPLAIDDAFQETHVPKVDDWDSYLYMVLRTVVQENQESFAINTPELDIFLGHNYLVTYHEEPISALEKIWELCHQDHRYLSKGVNYLLYHIADEIVTNTMEIMEDLDDEIDMIEDEIFTNPRPTTLEDIFSTKRVVLRLRRTLLPQREVLNKLGRGDFTLIQEHERVYFRDVYDHLVRLQEINESLRDLISGALDIYLSVLNNRMNDVMKTLTIITTLFMPLSFITGFFGMNFFQAVLPLNAWTGKIAFGIILAGMIIIPIGMFLWMRKRAWM
jgi:magnesium transporter